MNIQYGTYMRHSGKLAKALDDEVNWGAELAPLRRLSGLASDAEHRARSGPI